jgi:hypothetical protein
MLARVPRLDSDPRPSAPGEGDAGVDRSPNQERPHRSLDMRTPIASRMRLSQQRCTAGRAWEGGCAITQVRRRCRLRDPRREEYVCLTVWSRKRARSARLIKLAGSSRPDRSGRSRCKNRINELADVVLTLVLVRCHDDESAATHQYPGPFGVPSTRVGKKS